MEGAAQESMQSLASKLCAGICSSHKQEPTGMSVEESEETS